MSRIRQSFAWWSFITPGTSARELLAAAASIGYAAVDLIEPEYWPLATDAGLAISAVSGHASIEDGLNARENHARIRREIEDRLREAERWGIRNLICFSGSRRGLSDEDGASITIEGLRALAPLAEAAGVTLVLELLNSKVDHPDYQADRTAWGASVVRAVGSPSVRLLYDAYHMQVMEGDLVRSIQEHHDLIGHYHTAGNPGRNELDDSQEINYRAVFRAIGDTGFDGFVAHELIPTGDPVRALRQAFELLETSVAS